MIVKKQNYSYLLRIWQAGTGQEAAWRASLEEIRTGERRAFASLDHLLGYLREQITSGSPPGEADANEGSQPGPGDDALPSGRGKRIGGTKGLHLLGTWTWATADGPLISGNPR